MFVGTVKTISQCICYHLAVGSLCCLYGAGTRNSAHNPNESTPKHPGSATVLWGAQGSKWGHEARMLWKQHLEGLPGPNFCLEAQNSIAKTPGVNCKGPLLDLLGGSYVFANSLG